MNRTFARSDLVKTVGELRRNFEKDVDAASLLDVDVSLGLILYDLVTALKFTQAETKKVLGLRLFREVDAAVNGENGWKPELEGTTIQ